MTATNGELFFDKLFTKEIGQFWFPSKGFEFYSAHLARRVAFISSDGSWDVLAMQSILQFGINHVHEFTSYLSRSNTIAVRP